jgi:hypothetical protein
MDFMSDALADGRRFRLLNVVDDWTRECLAIEVGRSLTGRNVIVGTLVSHHQAGAHGHRNLAS